MSSLSRRELLKSAGAFAATGASALGAGAAAEQPPGARQGERALPGIESDVLIFLNTEEAKFIRAAVDRLIPADEKWGGALEAGALYYIDRQLASAYGAGARLYLKGPWDPEATPEQGYQLRFTPAELYRTAIGEILPLVREQHGGHEFWDLAAEEKDKVLKDIERGRMMLSSLPSAVFFETLLANTIEAFFADPAYGGNRGMIGWRMIGFPGAFAAYVGLVDKHGFVYEREPISIASSPADIAAAEART